MRNCVIIHPLHLELETATELNIDTPTCSASLSRFTSPVVSFLKKNLIAIIRPVPVFRSDLRLVAVSRGHKFSFFGHHPRHFYFPGRLFRFREIICHLEPKPHFRPAPKRL